jgi:hypothetical protein
MPHTPHTTTIRADKAGSLPVRTFDPLSRVHIDPGAYKAFVSPDLVNKRNSQAHTANAPLIRVNLNILYDQTQGKRFFELGRTFSATNLEIWLGLRMIMEGSGLNDPGPKQYERIVWM